MKKLIEVVEVEGDGLEGLLGQNILVLCENYFYTGKLVGVNKTFIKLESPSIVYETGAWTTKGYTDSQKLPVNEWFVERTAIESYGMSK